VRDIFLRDQLKNTTTRVSVSTSGIEANDFSDQPSISPAVQGGFLAVAFASAASNLGGFQDTAGFKDIFIRLPSTGVTSPVTLTSTGFSANGDSDNPSVTVLAAPNRVLVAFESTATNLVVGDFAGHQDIFLSSFLASSTDSGIPRQFNRITRGFNGDEANGPSFDPRITGDGRFIIYSSRATNLVPGTTAQGIQVYQYEIASGITTLVSANFSGQPANKDSFFPAVNYDGSVVTFSSAATNFITGQNTAAKIRLIALQRDRGIASIVNSLPDSQDPDGDLIGNSQVSPDGRFVAFSDSSTNLVSNDSNDVPDLFVRDLETGILGRVSTTATGGDAETTSDLPVIAGDTFTALSATVSFRSSASNITPGASGSPEIFGRGFVFSPLAVTRNSVLRVPADLTISRSQIRVKAIKFAGFLDTQSRKRDDRLFFKDTEKVEYQNRKIIVNYDFRIRKDGARRDTRQKLSTKNTITFRGLPPGTFTATYRTVTKQGKSVISQSPFSPVQRFTIPKKRSLNFS
jgi:hypothetical protein